VLLPRDYDRETISYPVNYEQGHFSLAAPYGFDEQNDFSKAWLSDGFPRMVSKVVCELFDYRMHDRDHCISVFKAHNAKVREVIPADRLLVYHVSEGWGPLCAFLGVPEPAEPVPKVNSRDEFASRIAAAAGDLVKAGKDA